MKNPIKQVPFWVIALLNLLSPIDLSSCSHYPDGEDFRYCMFHAHTVDLQQYRPFYFTSDFLGQGIPEMVETGVQQNLQEWEAYFNGKMSIEEIRKFLYDYESSSKDADYTQLEEVKNKAIHEYSLVQHLVNTQDKATLNYMLYAKEIEQGFSISSPWVDHEMSQAAIKKLITRAKKVYPQVNPSLQLRYGYQMVLLGRYLEDYEQAVQLYEQYVEPLHSQSIIKYWAMMHRATALHHTGQEAAADYNFALAFKHAPNKRHRAYQGFEGKDVEASLKFARTNAERAAIWLMNGIKSPGKALASIEKVQALSPNMPELKLLITREINKLEDWLLTPSYTGFNPASYYFADEETVEENKKNDRKYLGEVLTFVENSIPKQASNQQAFWNVAAAYLSFMNENYLQAQTYLQQAETAGNLEESIQNQIHLTRIMAFANDYGGISQEAENQLFESLQWLQKTYPIEENKGSNNYDAPRNNIHEKVLLALANRYEKNGDFPKAAMYIAQLKSFMRARTKEFIYATYHDYFFYLNEYANPKDLESILQAVDQKKKTPYQQFLTQEISKDKHKILDLLGTFHLRQDKLKESLAVFQQIPKDYWTSNAFEYETYLDANPFYAHFYSGHTKTVGDTIRYTKPEFVSEMLRLKAVASEGGLDEAVCNLLIANGYFNMTYYGNSWMMVRYWATAGWEYEIARNNKTQTNFEDITHFYGCTRAKEYYIKAAETASKCSFSALCYRMAGRCDHFQKSLENMLAAEGYWDYEYPEFKDNTYYNLLKTNFLEYYDRLINDCSSFKDFIAWGDY